MNLAFFPVQELFWKLKVLTYSLSIFFLFPDHLNVFPVHLICLWIFVLDYWNVELEQVYVVLEIISSNIVAFKFPLN